LSQEVLELLVTHNAEDRDLGSVRCPNLEDHEDSCNLSLSTAVRAAYACRRYPTDWSPKRRRTATERGTAEYGNRPAARVAGSECWFRDSL